MIYLGASGSMHSRLFAASCCVLSVVSFFRQFISVPSLHFGHVASLPGLVGVSWVGESELHGVGTDQRACDAWRSRPAHAGVCRFHVHGVLVAGNLFETILSRFIDSRAFPSMPAD